MRRFGLATAAFILVMGTTPASAETDSINAIGPMAMFTAPGSDKVLYSLTTAGNVVRRVGEFGVWQRIASPPGVSFFLGTGVAAAEPPSWWDYRRVYTVGGSPAALWEVSESGTWRSLGAPPGGSLSSAPSIAATYHEDEYGPGVRVAIRTSDRHVWTCSIFSPMAACYWEDETCRGGSCHLTSPQSPVEIAFDPYEATTDVLTITSSGIVQRYNWEWDQWTNLPALPPGWSADETDISAAYTFPELRVAVAARFFLGGERLYVARSTDATTWVWTGLIASGGEPINWRRFSLHQTYSPGWFPTYAIYYTNSQQNKQGVCFQPQLGGGTAYCAHNPSLGPSVGSLPGDLNPASGTVGPSIIGVADATWGSYRAYVAGTTMGPMTYVFEQQWDYDFGGSAWYNLLSARDTVSLADLTGAEFAAGARYGDVTVMGCEGNVYSGPYQSGWAKRSLDDGSTWTPAVQVFTEIGCDTNVSYDAAGNLYATALQEDRDNVQIARATGSSTWTAPVIIPPTIEGNIDRPWMTADRKRASFLYLVYSATAGGRIAYCNGTATCDNPAAWCPTAWSLPTLPGGCRGLIDQGPPGCWIEQSGSGDLWLAVQDDTGCPNVSGHRKIGIRRITNRLSLGATCAAPTWTAAECLYFVGGASTTKINGGTNAPGAYRRWGSRLAAARDTDRLLVTVQAYRDLGGGPCLASSPKCRSDILLATRTSAGWCTWGDCRPTDVRHHHMYVANFGDDPWPAPLPWEDHVNPVAMVFDHGIVANAWYDFRTDPTNNEQYRVIESWRQFAPSGGEFWLEYDYVSTTEGTFAQADVWYGDIDVAAVSSNHAFIPREVTVGGESNLIGYLWAPRSPHLH